MSDIDLKELVASLALAQQKTDLQLQQTDEQLQRTDAQLQRTDRKLDKIAKLVGNISNNQGDIAEEFFYNSLCQQGEVAGIEYDDIARGMEKHRGETQEEYDLVLTNDDTVILIEVKYKAHISDIDKVERKHNNFYKLFPIYKNHKLISGLASFYIDRDTADELKSRGYFGLKRSGNIIEVI